MSSISPSAVSEDVTWQTRANATLETFLENYCRVKRIERKGRLYEVLGMRRIYRIMAAIYHEAMLPTARDLREGRAPDLHPAEVKTRYADTGYYEIVNAIYCIVYLPLLIYLYFQRQKWLLAYSLGWLGLHTLCVLLERYKRSLGTAWLDDYRERNAPAAPPLPDEAPTPAFPRWLYRWYFRIAPFETERLYRAVGTERFRLFVVWLKQMTTLNPEREGAKQRIRYLDGITPNAIETFLEDTRISEITHVIGTLTLVPFLVVFIREGATPGLLLLVPLLWGNIYSVLLQRYHRVRVARIRQRRRRKEGIRKEG
jgi:hypothetical protein